MSVIKNKPAIVVVDDEESIRYSFETFLVDDEIMSRAASVRQGIDSFEADFSKSIIEEVGHGGSYLMNLSTMKHCRNFWTPPVSTMDSYQDWQKRGGGDITLKANETYKKILSECPDTILNDDIDRELQSFIEKQETVVAKA